MGFWKRARARRLQAIKKGSLGYLTAPVENRTRGTAVKPLPNQLRAPLYTIQVRCATLIL
jgi:hypothetical protein